MFIVATRVGPSACNGGSRTPHSSSVKCIGAGVLPPYKTPISLRNSSLIRIVHSHAAHNIYSILTCSSLGNDKVCECVGGPYTAIYGIDENTILMSLTDGSFMDEVRDFVFLQARPKPHV